MFKSDQNYYKWKLTNWRIKILGESRRKVLFAPSGDKLELQCTMAQLTPVMYKYEQQTDFKDWEGKDLALIQEYQGLL